MNLFDMTGPMFLAVWSLGWLGVVLGVVVMRAVVARSRAAADPDGVIATLPASAIGFVVGGLPRAVEAAVAGLHHAGLVKIDGNKLERVDRPPLPRGDGPYRGVAATELPTTERYILDHLPRSVGHLADSDGLADRLRKELEAAGMLVARTRATTALVWLFPVLWLGVGFAKLFVGVARFRAIEFLFLLLGFAMFACWKLVKVPRVTALGRAVIRRLVRTRRGLEATAATSPAQLDAIEMTLAYALFGPAVAGMALLAILPPPLLGAGGVASAGGCSTGVGSGCGASCGGGSSCGGGGCGGCSS